MIDVKQFGEMQKSSSRSFNDQKALIKKVMAGREIKCTTCGQIITFIPPEKSETPGVKCGKGCTDIELDFA